MRFPVKDMMLALAIMITATQSSAVYLNGNTKVDYPNIVKEDMIVADIEENLMYGDTIYLNDTQREFLTIFTEAEIETDETIILIHGMGSSANTPQVIHPLRTHLLKKFNTISIQMPVLKLGKKSDDYRPILFPISYNRIAATIKYLEDNDYDPSIIIGHSIGAAMTAHFLSKTLSPFSKFVAIGMPECAKEFLPRVDLAILDLFGTNDIPSVLSGILPKKNASSHNLNYTQMQLIADHNFLNEDIILVDTVYSWIDNDNN